MQEAQIETTSSLVANADFGSWVVQSFHRAVTMRNRLRQRSALLDLTDRQLRDVGIDLGMAGRGKSAAVSGATLSCLQGLR